MTKTCSFPWCGKPPVGAWKPKSGEFWYFPPIERCETHRPFLGEYELPDRGWSPHPVQD